MIKYSLYLGLTKRNGQTVNRDVAISWVTLQLKQRSIDGATIESALGVWRGAVEQTLIVHALADTPLDSIFKMIARIYAHDFDQEAVLFEKQTVAAEFLSW